MVFPVESFTFITVGFLYSKVYFLQKMTKKYLDGLTEETLAKDFPGDEIRGTEDTMITVCFKWLSPWYVRCTVLIREGRRGAGTSPSKMNTLLIGHHHIRIPWLHKRIINSIIASTGDTWLRCMGCITSYRSTYNDGKKCNALQIYQHFLKKNLVTPATQNQKMRKGCFRDYQVFKLWENMFVFFPQTTVFFQFLMVFAYKTKEHYRPLLEIYKMINCSNQINFNKWSLHSLNIIFKYNLKISEKRLFCQGIKN